ncbi:rod shape-determining protein RodA [Photobacterium damselae]|uniref:rod shape-determining protein RodA n=1 Tax=Photobacterium damselae TaxID=38293 RepID=UPI00083B6F2D|nr:rod shape-determining protein RodA [Photobacterium damselae]KAB1505865.1 rod shape-determining protein RodA [Photobacterium damselae subsp. damselae]ODA23837.1 rod shape-determining protein RodA [Photobacterium damselae subsp. damselae]TLS70063.1 rod shape-determining protein RodA [Photobacterium damselae subsp. damselae]
MFKRFQPHIDYPLLFAILTLITLSTLSVWSASSFSEPIIERHLVRAALAIGALIFMSCISPLRYQRSAPYLYGLTVLLLVGVFVLGDSTNGSQRWLEIGPIRFQPSELVKVAIPLMMAWIIIADAGRPTIKKIFLCLLVTSVPAGLIFIQPDLDGAIFTIIYALFVLYFAGMAWKIILSVLGVVAVSLPVSWYFVMAPYQKKRITQFLNPESDPLGAGYQIIQSKIAIGSGGIKGKGWMDATQGNLGFIPESHTDFIFSTFAEEWGYIGSVVLLALYLFITARVLWLACQTESPFSRLVSAAFALSFFLYSFINIGMVSGVLPVMGSPLPFFSYGGSAIITQGAIFGMIMSLNLRKPSIVEQSRSRK